MTVDVVIWALLAFALLLSLLVALVVLVQLRGRHK